MAIRCVYWMLRTEQQGMPLPLFFLCVRTNVSYIVVGVFVTQQESAESITEALKIFKSWNPTWCPTYFMVDFDSSEILALEQVFPSSIVLLCDFHREKAWGEWCSKIDNGVSEVKEVLLSYLRAVANATTVESCDAAIQTLKNSNIWKTKNKLRQWFENTWLSEKKVINHYCRVKTKV